jgi:membrane-associated phospholipid phosphatase
MIRQLRIQSLEQRLCFHSAWQHQENPLDVDGSSLVTPIDAVQVANRLHYNGNAPLGSHRPEHEPFCDTDGDGILTENDLRLVVDEINRYSAPIAVRAELSSTADPNRSGSVLTETATIHGSSLAFATIRINVAHTTSTQWQVQADASGNWQSTLPLQLGNNQFTVTATDPLGRSASQQLDLRRVDFTQEWNTALLTAVRQWRGSSTSSTSAGTFSPPPLVARNLAMVHTAMFDAYNAVERRYDSYLELPPLNTATNEDFAKAAAVSAAYHVAKSLYPEAGFAPLWQQTLLETLFSVTDNIAKENGREYGQQVARKMLDMRANDAQATGPLSNAPLDSITQAQVTPGHWQPTPPSYSSPLLPNWPQATPFVLNSADQFRVDTPPALDTDDYRAAVDEVMRLGGSVSSQRTPDQTEIAHFWADGGGTFTPPGHWNQIASEAMDQAPRSQLENARTFALLNLTLADAGITSWDAKFHYNYWRPIDAIRALPPAARDNTVEWVPLLTTPPFPSYTSGHSTFSGAAAQMLTQVFGENFAFTSTMDSSRQTAPPVKRSFTSFHQAAAEAGMSRIYGGIHFNFDNTPGLLSGSQVAQFVWTTTLLPI